MQANEFNLTVVGIAHPTILPRPFAVTQRATRLATSGVIALGIGTVLAQPPIQPAQPPTQTLRYPTGMDASVPPVAMPPLGQVPAGPPAPSSSVLFQPGQIVARVGDKTILYGDVAPTVNLILALTKNEAERQAIEYQKEALVKSLVMQAVQTKMLLLEFERGMPSKLKNDPAERAKAESKLGKNVRDAFDRSLQSARERAEKANEDDLDQLMRQEPTIMRLALLMKQRGLVSQGELDMALREMGTTLGQQAKDYGDHIMGIEAVQTNLKFKGKDKKAIPVTHQEMLDFYREHIQEYQVPAKVTFEVLTARTTRFNGDRQAAFAHAAMMGNEVYLGGVPFAAVAKKHSQEPQAEDGGKYEGISPGSLASKTIDAAVFSLEIGKLSQIIEDEQGFHILRVKERTAAGVTSFEEQQVDIRKKIEQQKRSAEQQKYLTELKARTKIWTIYDPPVETAQAAGTSRR